MDKYHDMANVCKMTNIYLSGLITVIVSSHIALYIVVK